MFEKLKVVGNIYKSRVSGDFVITEYKNYHSVVIMFLNTGTVKNARMDHILTGKVKDDFIPNVGGVGVSFGCKGDNNTQKYKKWVAMISRCYRETERLRCPSYNDCSVSDNFKNYSYFSKWYTDQIGAENENWHLDKDIIIKGNKVYSENTCAIVPPEINLLVGTTKGKRGIYPLGVSGHKTTGRFRASIHQHGKSQHLGLFDSADEAFVVYKRAKEEYIKVIANKWKGVVDDRVYDSLMNWNVHPDD